MLVVFVVGEGGEDAMGWLLLVVGEEVTRHMRLAVIIGFSSTDGFCPVGLHTCFSGRTDVSERR